LVDFNIRDPITQNTQPLPRDDVEYADTLNFNFVFKSRKLEESLAFLSKLFSTFHISMLNILKEISNPNLLKNKLNVKEPEMLNEGFELAFNASQNRAIRKSLTHRLNLIQGPPGTGKTVVLAGIVHNWIKQSLTEPILICAPTNFAADVIAKVLYNHAELSQRILRVYSFEKEDLFNIKPETLQPYTALFKIVYMGSSFHEAADQFI